MKKTTFVFILLVVLISAKKGAKNKAKKEAKEDPEGSFFFHFILSFFLF
jgi:hypothetical protein